MFPLRQRKLIRGYQAHINAGLGGAADYEADHVELYAPFDGRIETYWGNQGGNWTRLIRDNGHKIEMAHLSKYFVKSGQVREGQLLAITGNTGQVTTGPHKHIQIIDKNGKRLDPEKYNWEETKMKLHVTFINNSVSLDRLAQYTRGRVIPTSNTVPASFSSIPFADFNGAMGVETNWYRENITPLASGQISVFVVNQDQWQGTYRGWMGWNDVGRPVRISIVRTDFLEDDVLHEIAHAFFHLTGQQDRVHELLYQNPPKWQELFDLIDYQKLEQKLLTIQGVPMAQIITQAKGAERRIVLKAADQTEWLSLCKVFGKDPNKPEETV